LDASRARGEFSFALKADVAYDHYHKFASDLSDTVYDIVPMIRYDQGNWDFVLGGNFVRDYTVLDRAVGGARAKYYVNGVDATWNLNLNEKWGVAVTGEYENKNYSDKDFDDEDYDLYEVTVAPYYVFSPKTKVGLSMGYAVKEYDRNLRYADSDTLTLNAFVDYRVTGKISIHADAGVEFVNYDDLPWDVYKENDALFNGGLVARYAMLSNLDIRLGLKHKHADNSGFTGGMQQDTDALLGVDWRINSKLTLSQNLTHRWSDKKDGAVNDNTEITYDATLSYDVTDKLRVYGSYEYGNTDYCNLPGGLDADYSTHIYLVGVRYTF
jgi:opacity protein-like surface antigen